MRMFALCSAVLSAVIALSGCTALPVSPASPLPLRTELPLPTMEPIIMPTPLQQPTEFSAQGSSGITGEVPAELLAAVMADAAARTGIPEDGLAVIQDQAVVWPDGSLGCPQPGMMYTQALVDGYHILIKAGESVLDYRATQRGSFTLCERALRVPPAQTPDK